jgi:hypothetical protein
LGTFPVRATLVDMNETHRQDPLVRPNEKALFVYLNVAAALLAALTVGLSYHFF